MKERFKFPSWFFTIASAAPVSDNSSKNSTQVF